jgi:transposase
MTKKINPELRAWAMRMVQEHQQDYSSQTAAAQALAKQLGRGRETVRRWMVQAEVDDRGRPGSARARSSAEGRSTGSARTSRSCVPQRLSSRESSTPSQPLIKAFVDDMIAGGSRGRVDLWGAARAGRCSARRSRWTGPWRPSPAALPRPAHPVRRSLPLLGSSPEYRTRMTSLEVRRGLALTAPGGAAGSVEGCLSICLPVSSTWTDQACTRRALPALSARLPGSGTLADTEQVTVRHLL